MYKHIFIIIVYSVYTYRYRYRYTFFFTRPDHWPHRSTARPARLATTEALEGLGQGTAVVVVRPGGSNGGGSSDDDG